MDENTAIAINPLVHGLSQRSDCAKAEAIHNEDLTYELRKLSLSPLTNDGCQNSSKKKRKKNKVVAGLVSQSRGVWLLWAVLHPNLMIGCYEWLESPQNAK